MCGVEDLVSVVENWRMTWSSSGNSILNDTDIQRNKDIIPQTPEKT